MEAADQVISIFAVNEGYADDVEVKEIARFEKELIAYVKKYAPEIREDIMSGKKMSAEQMEHLRSVILQFKEVF